MKQQKTITIKRSDFFQLLNLADNHWTGRNDFVRKMIRKNKGGNMKVYIWAKGAYEDYCIEKVFTNKGQAERFASLNGYVEEYDIVDEKEEPRKFLHLYYYPEVKEERNKVSAGFFIKEEEEKTEIGYWAKHFRVLLVREVAFNCNEPEEIEKYLKVAKELEKEAKGKTKLVKLSPDGESVES